MSDAILPGPRREGAWVRLVPVDVLADEPVRRLVVDMTRDEAAKHGFHGRIRFVKNAPLVLNGVQLFEHDRPFYTIEVTQ